MYTIMNITIELMNNISPVLLSSVFQIFLITNLKLASLGCHCPASPNIQFSDLCFYKLYHICHSVSGLFSLVLHLPGWSLLCTYHGLLSMTKYPIVYITLIRYHAASVVMLNQEIIRDGRDVEKRVSLCRWWAYKLAYPLGKTIL